MEILFRSVALAGGIDVSPEISIVSPGPAKSRRGGLLPALAKALRGLGDAADRLGDRIATDAAPTLDGAVPAR